MKFRALIPVLCAALMLLASPGLSQAATFTGSSGTRAASADFVIIGGQLRITLTNTSTFDTLVPSDVLTGVYFNSTSALTPGSAALGAGSTAHYGTIVNNVGEGWSYGNPVYNPNPVLGTTNTGISAAGMGAFGQANFFSPPVTPLDGIGYGLLSAGDNVSTANGGITGNGGSGGPYPLIKNSVVFFLNFVPNTFGLNELGNTVVFQYGTNFGEPYILVTGGRGPNPVPVPPTLALSGMGLISLLAYGRKRRMA